MQLRQVRYAKCLWKSELSNTSARSGAPAVVGSELLSRKVHLKHQLGYSVHGTRLEYASKYPNKHLPEALQRSRSSPHYNIIWCRVKPVCKWYLSGLSASAFAHWTSSGIGYLWNWYNMDYMTCFRKLSLCGLQTHMLPQSDAKEEYLHPWFALY